MKSTESPRLTLAQGVAGVWAVVLILGWVIFAVASCGPELMPEPVQREEPAPAMKEEVAPPVIEPPRLEVRVAASGRKALWDSRAGAFCERQPLCASCTLPWDENPHYCVPVELTPFALGAWFVDPFCSIRLFGLPQGAASHGVRPLWAYNFDETRKRAKAYRVRLAGAAELARPFKVDLYDPKSSCERVSENEISTALLNFAIYVQVQEYGPDEWVPWGEAQKVLGGSP